MLASRSGLRPSAPRRLPALAAAVAGLALLLGSSCRAPATVDDVPARFRTPEQTIATFQRGMREDLPAIEFRSLAVELVERHGLSELAYREFRQVSGWVRAGVARARVEERVQLSPERVHVSMVTSGPLGLFCRRFGVELVRETFWEIRSGERLLADELSEDLNQLLELVDGPSGPILIGSVELPLHLDPRAGGDPITELRIGTEWKIADIHLSGELSGEAAHPPQSETGTDPPISP